MIDPPSIDELDAMREERGINGTTMSIAVGYESDTSWFMGVKNGCMSDRMKFTALLVFAFYDEEGYVPLVEVR